MFGLDRDRRFGSNLLKLLPGGGEDDDDEEEEHAEPDGGAISVSRSSCAFTVSWAGSNPLFAT